MARNHLMTWNASQKRWFKKFRKRQYAVGCGELSERFPEIYQSDTKNGSGQAANEWWKAKHAEIVAKAEIQKPHRMGYSLTIENLRKKAAWCRKHDPERAPGFQAEADRLQEIFDSSDEPPPLGQVAQPDIPMGSSMEWVWQDRLQHLDDEPTNPDRSINTYRDRWLTKLKLRVGAGDITADRYGSYRYAINYFVQFVGGDRPIDEITADALDRYHQHLLEQVAQRKLKKGGMAARYAKDRLDTAKAFVRYCVQIGDIPLPKNMIDSKTLQVRIPKTGNNAVSVEGIKALLKRDDMSERVMLYILLMLNCGMYPTDIGNLQQDEVDWKSGRIRRKRTKEQDHASVPTVCYRLWDRTFVMLQAHRSNHDTLALTNETNDLPLYRKWVGDDGRAKKVDNVSLAYKRAKIGIPLSKLRKTSSSLLYNEKRFRSLHTLFLGHSPRTVAEIHYVTPDDDVLDEAIDWLAEQYELLEASKKPSDSDPGS